MKMNRLEKKFVNSKKHGLADQKIFEKVVGILNLSELRDVLEIGCGAGKLSNYLSQIYDLHVTGTDIDPEQIETAKTRYGERTRLSFQTADATALPFEDGSFDIVISFKVLHHIQGWEKAIEEVKRVLRSTGYYILNDFAFPAWACGPLGRMAKNSGVYTTENVSDVLQDNEMTPIWKEDPRGIFLKRFSVVCRTLS